jgi:CheY-like chemotaxis protein
VAPLGHRSSNDVRYRRNTMTTNIKKPILLVEDDEAIRQALRDVLTTEGYLVYCAANGRVALNLLPVIPRPCVILVDLMMPVMSGRELLAELREDDGFAAIPVTVISAARDLSGLGDLPVLTKPIAYEQLLLTIEELVSRADRPRQVATTSEAPGSV